MDASVEVTALARDSSGSDNLVSSDVGCTSSDIKLAENGEIMSESITDNIALEGGADSSLCTKSNTFCSSSLLSTCENNPAKSIEDKITTDCLGVDKDDGHIHLDHVSGTNADTDGDNIDEGEIADSRSQTPLQDELEPEVDELNQDQAATVSNTELDPSTVVHDSTAKTDSECTEMAECTSDAVQNSREENGELSDDDDERTAGNSASQQLPGDVKPLDEEKTTQELESRKVVCVLSVCLTTVLILV